MRKRLTFKQFVSFLRKHHKAKKKVIVVRTNTELNKDFDPPEYDFGETINNKDHYYIRINQRDTLRIQKDTLMHEWAHCLVPWDKEPVHSDEWGIAYARIFQSFDEKLL